MCIKMLVHINCKSSFFFRVSSKLIETSGKKIGHPVPDWVLVAALPLTKEGAGVTLDSAQHQVLIILKEEILRSIL